MRAPRVRRLLLTSLAPGLLALGCRPGGAPAADAALAEPAPPVCGDGVVNAGEECDDANQNDTDGCLRTCFRPARWLISDPHIHSRGCGGHLDPEGLLSVSSARDSDVTAALVWGTGYNTDRAHFTGNDHPASRPDALIHYDLEVSAFAADRTGHLVLLGLQSIDFAYDPFSEPRSGMPVLSWARGQGPRVVAGMAHGQFFPAHGFPSPPVVCCMPWDFPVEAIRGRLDFLETERREIGPPLDPGTARLWRLVLNAGARIALAGASDYPCIHHFITNDTPRTDVLLERDEELSYDTWLDAMRAGRTVLVAAGSGTHLNLRVAGAPLGSELNVARGTRLALSIETVADQRAPVVILVNGSPALTVHMDAGVQAAAASLELSESAWIAASNPWATTSPIYALVDGRPIRGSAADICELKRYVEHLSGLVRSRRIDLGPERAQALAAYAEVAAELDVRLAESGATGC